MNEKNGYETHLLSQKKSYGTINQFRPEYLIYWGWYLNNINEQARGIPGQSHSAYLKSWEAISQNNKVSLGEIAVFHTRDSTLQHLASTLVR